MTSEPVGNSPRGNIPANSHKEREKAQAPAPETRERLESVVTGPALRQRQPWYKRAAHGVLAEDAPSVGSHVLLNVVLPATKNLIYDVIVGAVGQGLYGNGRPRGAVGGPGSVLAGARPPLRTQYDNPAALRPPAMSQEDRARHNFDNIVLMSHQEAVNVLEGLYDCLQRYGRATVTDLYDLCGVTGSFADQKWGWYDLTASSVRTTREGFLLDLPRPELMR